MKATYCKYSKYWFIVDKSSGYVSCEKTPAECKRKARQWFVYLHAPTDELANKYLSGEIYVK